MPFSLTHDFTKEYTYITNKQIKWYSTLLAISEIKIKTTCSTISYSLQCLIASTWYLWGCATTCTFTCWWEYKMSPQKFGSFLLYDPAIPFLEFTLHKWGYNHTKLYMNVYSNSICDCPKLEKCRCPSMSE